MKNKFKFIIIFNQTNITDRKDKKINKILELLKIDYEVEIFKSYTEVQANDIYKNLKQKKLDRLIVAGGDWSFNLAINEIVPTETGMSVSTEILLKVSNKGLSLAEVPITISYDGDTSTQNPVSHGTSVFATTMKYVSIRHPLLFYGLPGIILFLSGIGLGMSFIDAYLYQQQIFYGSLFGSILLILIGAILSLAAVLLYSMANLMRDKN